MKTTIKTAEAIVGKSVEFTMRELEQVAEICDKVVASLESVRTPNAKPVYLTKNDLERIEAIFMCILESESDIAETDFDRYIRLMHQTNGADNDIDKIR